MNILVYIYIFFFKTRASILVHWIPGVASLGHMLCACSGLAETAEQFSSVVIPTSCPISSVGELQWCHILPALEIVSLLTLTVPMDI